MEKGIKIMGQFMKALWLWSNNWNDFLGYDRAIEIKIVNTYQDIYRALLANN